MNGYLIKKLTPELVQEVSLTLKEVNFGDHTKYILPKAVQAFIDGKTYDFFELLLLCGFRKMI